MTPSFLTIFFEQAGWKNQEKFMNYQRFTLKLTCVGEIEREYISTVFRNHLQIQANFTDFLAKILVGLKSNVKHTQVF